MVPIPASTHCSPEALVLSHRQLALNLARRYIRSRDQRDDLEQAACLGLVKAARRFDPSRGTSFTAFATPTILGELRRHCRDTRWALHVPRPTQEQVQALRRVEDQIVGQGRQCTVGAAAAALGWTEDEVVEARLAAACLAPASLNAPVHDTEGEPGEVLDAIGGVDAGYEAAEQRDLIRRALADVPPRARLALRLHIDGELTTPEVAARLGMSEPQARRLVREARRVARSLHEARPPGRRPYVRLADVDPELFRGLGHEELATARERAVAPAIEFAAGPWNPHERPGAGQRHDLGLLVCAGALLRTVGGRDGPRSELLGPGDVIRPWLSDASWHVVQPCLLAALDKPTLRILCRWPSAVAALMKRTTRRTHMLAVQLAVTELRHIDDRLLILYQCLAERWGEPGPEGIAIPLGLKHDMIAQLLGAHRPTVTSALQRLQAQRRVVRKADGTWLLLEPPALAAAA